MKTGTGNGLGFHGKFLLRDWFVRSLVLAFVGLDRTSMTSDHQTRAETNEADQLFYKPVSSGLICLQYS